MSDNYSETGGSSDRRALHTRPHPLAGTETGEYTPGQIEYLKAEFIAQQAAEIERLRAELGREGQLRERTANDLAKVLQREANTEDEIEALSEEVEGLTAEVKALRDKALRFDLDQAGIERRDAEAVELVEARAEIERLRGEVADLRISYETGLKANIQNRERINELKEQLSAERQRARMPDDLLSGLRQLDAMTIPGSLLSQSERKLIRDVLAWHEQQG
jgi:chromosome segregation ATPase